MRKLSLKDLEVKSFVINDQLALQAGLIQAVAVDGRLDMGETLNERPCTFPSMEPEGC